MGKTLVYGMTDNPGGIEMYLLNIFEKINIEEKYMDFVTDFPSIAYEKRLKEKGAKIFYIPAKSKSLIKHWSCLNKLLKAHPEYTTVYFNILDAGAAFTMLIPWLRKRRIVVHSHNGSTDKMVLHRMCRPILTFLSTEYIACSRLAARYMFGENIAAKKETLIIPNAIDAERFDFNQQTRMEIRAKYKWTKKLVVCHVGRLSLQKNPLGLLEIFNAVKQKHVESVLVSIGSGEMEEEVKVYSEALGIKDSVCFMGKRNDIPDLLQAADVFVLPSFYEGLPIVAIEAQASGLYCILSDSITEEVKVTENVLFLPLCNLELWASEIIKKQKSIRKSQKDKIRKAGYDINDFENTIELLKEKLIIDGRKV